MTTARKSEEPATTIPRESPGTSTAREASRKTRRPARAPYDLYALHTPSQGDGNDSSGKPGQAQQQASRKKREASKGKEVPATRTGKATSVLRMSIGATVLVSILALAFPERFFAVTTAARDAIASSAGWHYLLLVLLIVAVCAGFAISPIGIIRLGDPTDKPRVSTVSWIAMLFSAGMGIGLVFWGAAEPLAHFASAAPEAPTGSYQALRDAFRYTFFHWGFSAWAIYAIVALALAYFQFRKKEKALLSVTLKPLFGERMDGLVGRLVDALTAFATVVGVGVSLGMGAAQINGGLNYLLGVPQNIFVELAIIVVATALFLASAMSGLSKGVRLLSNVNVILAIALVAVCVAVGPTTQILNALTAALGSYLQNFVSMSTNVAPYDAARQAWVQGWTIFYWAWWIAWSPFVGVFIARISRGRTIREFLLGVVLVPTVFACIWFATFGTMSTGVQLGGVDLASLPTESVLFATLSSYPLGGALSVVALVLIMSFFVTSADSATFVLGMISEDGSLNPRRRTKFVWGVTLSVLAAVLLAAGGLDALQNVLIITALPFSLVILLMAVSLIKELNHERLMMGLYVKPTAFPEEDRPFKSYEGDEAPDPVSDMQQHVDALQQIAEITSADAPASTGNQSEGRAEEVTAHGRRSSYDG